MLLAWPACARRRPRSHSAADDPGLDRAAVRASAGTDVVRPCDGAAVHPLVLLQRLPEQKHEHHPSSWRNLLRRADRRVIGHVAIAPSAEHLREGQSAVFVRWPRLECPEFALKPGEFRPVVSAVGLASTGKALLRADPGQAQRIERQWFPAPLAAGNESAPRTKISFALARVEHPVAVRAFRHRRSVQTCNQKEIEKSVGCRPHTRRSAPGARMRHSASRRRSGPWRRPRHLWTAPWRHLRWRPPEPASCMAPLRSAVSFPRP